MGATASSIQNRVDALVAEFSITEWDMKYYAKLIETKMQREKKNAKKPWRYLTGFRQVRKKGRCNSSLSLKTTAKARTSKLSSSPKHSKKHGSDQIDATKYASILFSLEVRSLRSIS